LQAHVGGPIVKFYAVADGRFFSWYSADGAKVDISEQSLRELVFAAARAVGLEVFGGDVAFPQPDAPVLIDLNDWPSFAPVRVAAAAAIAAYIDEKAWNAKRRALQQALHGPRRGRRAVGRGRQSLRGPARRRRRREPRLRASALRRRDVAAA